MERRQRDVGRQALGCHKAADMGWSSFEAWEASSKIPYDGRLRLIDDAKRLYQLQHKCGFFSEPVDASTETEWTSAVRKRVRDYETQQWLQDAQTKSTLGVYLANKKTIASEVRLYDNSLGNRFLCRFDTTATSTTCRVNDETVEHIVLDCARLERSRSQDKGPRLPKPLALAEALGVTDSEIGQFTAICPATGLKVASNDTKRLVVDTKRRLED
ncbi:hypothetical protein HPB47_002992 [Ixodes persulcatus]|uniref:Uncharacterized protein n=1 Tax=Ixodes persulcatus TaxID=34615 RepID=A0AC60PJP9_IXOPE|nr:hypothetical protein HPB47_002992 [Ixodes persulcatus]